MAKNVQAASGMTEIRGGHGTGVHERLEPHAAAAHGV